LQTRLKRVTNAAVAFVVFTQPMRIPANISAMDSGVMGIKVIPGPDSEDKYLKILKWKVIGKL
jgi:hypothetical protein